MKKIFNYLMVCTAAAAILSGCRPMDKTYNELGPVSPVVKTVTPPTIASITLVADDYSKLPASDAASVQFFFPTTAAAFVGIPTILTKNYPNVGENSQINVTYATSPVVPSITLADDLNSNIAYTLQTTPTDDYKWTATTTPSGTIPANSFDDLSATAVINFLKLKYQTPLPNNSIRVLTYIYFETGVTGTSGTLTTDAFLYTTANGWQKIYRVNNAQYASVNRGTNFMFLAADVPNLPVYFNNFLKADQTVMAVAKTGDVQYVNYRVYSSATVSYQEVMPLVFDGTNWVTSNTTATNLFTFSGGVWTGQLDNTVSYILAKADYPKIAANTALGASAAAITNLNANGNFALSGTNRWTDTQIANGIIPILQSTYASPSVNQKFLVTVKTYSQYPTLTFTFVYDGTTFVYQPAPDKTKYTITGDDYDAISKLTTTGATAAALTNVGSFGDFSLSGGTLWTDAQINIGLATVLQTRYPTAAANQTVVVTYAVYSGGNKVVTRTFKFNGTAWAAQ